MIRSILEIATPYLLAALGGLYTELAGVLNISLEGLMLLGAFAAVLGAYFTGSLAIGIICALVAGAFAALIFHVFTSRLKANIFIVGLAINLLAMGVIGLASTAIFGTKGVIGLPDARGIQVSHIPVLHGIPFIGDVLSGHSALTYLSWLFGIISFLVIRHSHFGIGLRSTGHDAEIVRKRGKNPEAFRLYAVILSGLAAALGGAALSLGLAGFVPNMSAGRGWIALVAIYLGRRRPLGVFAACLFFACAEYLANSAQGWFNVPRTLTLAFPYVITLAFLILFGIVRHRRG